MTKREVLNGILAMVRGEEMNVALVDIEKYAVDTLDAMDRRSSKETKKQRENAELRDKIVDFLGTVDFGLTISDIREQCPEMAPFSANKVNALVKQLKDSGTVIRTVDKGTAYFSLAR
jgi:hypothetical protein